MGNEIEHYISLESTNDEAFELIGEGFGEGTVVITEHQTAGKGRQGRKWFSAPGKGLTFSIILTPNLPIQQGGLLSLLAGLATAQAMEQLKLEPTLKWPNDILFSGKKCGGILVESKVQGDTMTHAVIGIGINVNESKMEFPEDIRETATSIAIEKGASVQRELVLAWILNTLEKWYTILKSQETTSIISAWQTRCAHLGKEVSFTHKDKTTYGLFHGVDEDGKAIIKTDTEQIILSSEEISLNL